jgi:hypothetical protein
MELHFGMIRDKEGIRAGLADSRASNRQLAICYTSANKLLVKICTVADLPPTDGRGLVTLKSQGEDGRLENLTVMLDDIESIYPINDFPSQE